MRQHIPRINVTKEMIKEAEAITLKNRHCVNVHLNVGAMNMDAQAARYTTAKNRKAVMAFLCSRRTEIQPYVRVNW